MANIEIRGVEYNDIKKITVPFSDTTGDAVFVDTSDSNAAAGDILTGKTAFVDGSKLTGTMLNNGAVGGTINKKADEILISNGYTTGGSVSIATSEQDKIVSENIKAGISILGVDGKYSVVDTEQSDATSPDIVSGKTAFVNGSKITGTMLNNGYISRTISNKTDSVTIPAGYTSGGSVSIATAERNKIVSGNIRKGVTVLGVTGSNTVVDTANATATSDDILSPATAYVNGQFVVGSAMGAGNDYELISGDWLGTPDVYSNSRVTVLSWGFPGTTTLSAVTEIKQYAMCYEKPCETIILPALETIGEGAFFGNFYIETLDAGALESMATSAFRTCSNFSKLIIRNTNGVATMSATSALVGTMIANGRGFIYVPDALVDSYKAATNWSTYANQIKGLSELV